MKITILTFQFAHNYGALLQAYALKQYLQNQNFEVKIAPYYPKWAQAEYAISPFAKDISLKRRIRLASQYFKRREQGRVFDKFISENLEVIETFSSEQELNLWLNQYDCVICGSDQIWNDKITGNGAAYFAAETYVRKISYAASLGTTQLTNVQRNNIQRYLPEFSAISVREPSSSVAIEGLLDKKINVVLDPVFLVDDIIWSDLGKPVNLKDKYLLLYFLQENEMLLKYAKDYAKQNGLKIYDVHPTMADRHDGCSRINNVGPKEFIWLIQNAECVCTNSFHATAFSTIFKKKLIHIPNSKSPERTTSLLERAGVELKTFDEFPYYDLSLGDQNKLKDEVQQSKEFILNALKGED